MRFQLSIRDLLLAIAIIALAAGWWIDRQRINQLAVQKWEYHVEMGAANDSLLDNFGREGWDVISVTDHMMTMKRRKQ